MANVTDQEPLTRKGRPEAPARRRLAVNYFFQLLNQLVRICEQLLLVPLYLAAWGTEVYKDWVVLYAIMTFLTSCNFGTETYFGNRFIEFVARGDREAFRRELMTAMFCTLAVGLLVLLLPSLGDLRRLLPPSLLFFTLPLSLALVQSGPVMLFGALGVSALPILSYTLIRTFTGLTRQAANQFAVGSGIEMARQQARCGGEAR